MKKESRQRLYYIWYDMKRRCDNPDRSSYKYYGGRGISYCDEWKDFNVFHKDMYKTYSDNMTIDRIDNDKDYCKSNCQWMTMQDQNKKHTNCVKVTYNGDTLNISDMARKYNIKPNTFQRRLWKGWSIERSITQSTNNGRWE